MTNYDQNQDQESTDKIRLCDRISNGYKTSIFLDFKISEMDEKFDSIKKSILQDVENITDLNPGAEDFTVLIDGDWVEFSFTRLETDEEYSARQKKIEKSKKRREQKIKNLAKDEVALRELYTELKKKFGDD